MTHVIWGGVEPVSSSNSSAGFKEGSNPAHEISDLLAGVQLQEHESSGSSGNVISAKSSSQLAHGQEPLFKSRLEVGNPGAAIVGLSEQERAAVALLVEEYQEELRPALPAASSLSQMWSQGSTLHVQGHCRPCRDVVTSKGCATGQACMFCHSPHSKKSRSRPCKSKRLKCNQFVKNLETLCQQDPDRLAEAVVQVPVESPYVKGVLKQKLQRARDQDEAGPSTGASASSGSAALPPRSDRLIVSL